MATIKFSAFSPGGTGDGATTQLVGFKVGDATANYKYSISDLATMLSPSIDNFYTANGTIGTTRIAKVTDTVTFQNVGGTSSLFSLNTDGTFTLGSDASVHSNNAVAVGTWALATGSKAVSIGAYSSATALNSIGIGYDADSTASFAMTWGGVATNSGANSILLSSDGATKTLNSDANSLKIHVNSHLWPDFSIIGGVSKFSFDADSFSTLTVIDASHTTLATGESGNLTLDAGGEVIIESNLKVTGQAYSEQHDSLAGNATVDWNNGNNQYIQLASGANTFTPSNPLDGATYILQIKQPSAGAAGTVTWGATVKWPAAAAPTLTATNDAIDVVTLVYNGTTSHYYATSILNLS